MRTRSCVRGGQNDCLGDRTTGDIYALVILNTTGEVLKSVIETILCTDPFAVYRCIDRDHQWVNHRKKQWVKEEVHMSGISASGPS